MEGESWRIEDLILGDEEIKKAVTSLECVLIKKKYPPHLFFSLYKPTFIRDIKMIMEKRGLTREALIKALEHFNVNFICEIAPPARGAFADYLENYNALNHTDKYNW